MARFSRFFIPAVRFRAFAIEVQNLDGQGLRMEWEVTRDNTQTPDEGVIRIFNLAPVVSGTIYEMWEARAALLAFKSEIEIGWDGTPQQLMIGDTWDITPQERTTTDVITTLKFGDGAQALRDQVVGQTFNGANITWLVQRLVTFPPRKADAGLGGLGLLYPAESKTLVEAAAAVTPTKVLRRLVKGRNTRATVSSLMEIIGLEWRIHNGAFVAMRGGVINRPGPILRPSTGLLGYSKRNDGGILVEALANPDVEPGIQIQVQDDLEKPFGALVYRVEKVRFRGTTAGESLMSIEAAQGFLA